MHKYFSIPYKNRGRDFNGCDCYGLVKIMAKHEDGVELPDFIYDNSQDNSNGRFYKEELKNKKWVKVEPCKGAIVLLRIEGVDKHCGYMINNHQFMHILGEAGVNIGSIKDNTFKDRVVGFWKYKDKND